jgi:hypothetical protein
MVIAAGRHKGARTAQDEGHRFQGYKRPHRPATQTERDVRVVSSQAMSFSGLGLAIEVLGKTGLVPF